MAGIAMKGEQDFESGTNWFYPRPQGWVCIHINRSKSRWAHSKHRAVPSNLTKWRDRRLISPEDLKLQPSLEQKEEQTVVIQISKQGGRSEEEEEEEANHHEGHPVPFECMSINEDFRRYHWARRHIDCDVVYSVMLETQESRAWCN